MFTFQGCFPFLESRLRFYSIALITEGILLALLLFSQTISAFVLNYYADPLLGNYDAVNTLEWVTISNLSKLRQIGYRRWFRKDEVSLLFDCCLFQHNELFIDLPSSDLMNLT